MRGEERRGSLEAPDQFRTRLAELKRNGCNILLVGTDALDMACERLLGESSAGPRYRLFVTTDARPAGAHAKLASVQSGPYTDSAAVVDWDADIRGATGRDQRDQRDLRGEPSQPTSGPGVRDSGGTSLRKLFVESDDLRDLGEAVNEIVESFESEHGGLSPAELRLCFQSVTPLVAEYEHKDARRFLLGLTETVDQVGGMAHYHLPADYDSETVGALEPLFDAVVEVRQTGEEVEQRWHLASPKIATDWLPL